MTPIYIVMTMDCESAKVDMSDHGYLMSSSGPSNYEQSEKSIRGFLKGTKDAGYPTTLFLHPEVARENRKLVLEAKEKGTCLGLHIHPYKLANSEYTHDLGAYSADEQRVILQKSISVWEDALGEKPVYFRGGYFSANDNTFRVLEELGFKGGSLSNPGRSLTSHFSVWKGAEPYPHRAHKAFRLASGDSEFVEIPISVAYGRPVAHGHAGEEGYEWPYIPHTYDHERVVSDILNRFSEEKPLLGCYVTDTHNDQDYTDPDAPASINLARIVKAIEESCNSLGFEARGATIAEICNLARKTDHLMPSLESVMKI